MSSVDTMTKCPCYFPKLCARCKAGLTRMGFTAHKLQPPLRTRKKK
jgi:hypothetical protein